MEHKKTDIILLFITRITRLFAYGFLSVTLALYLAEIGLDVKEIGLLFTLTLIGDSVISLWITTSADYRGRRRMLILGAVLMIMAGIVFTMTRNPIFLILAAIVGVISPSGYETGPFLSIEQAALTQLVSDKQRTHVFAWYNLVGSFATAAGSLAGGVMVHVMEGSGFSRLVSYRSVIAGYTLSGLVLLLIFYFLSSAIEVKSHDNIQTIKRFLWLHRSRNAVLRLSALFSMDAFAGGLIMQSIFAYWFYVRFGVDAGTLGGIFFGANVLAGISALLAVRLSSRIGLINTMVFTHIPSNILLCLIPLMPNLNLAIAVMMLRFSISQMDVPTRQSFTMAVVSPDERSAAAGITNIARSVGSSLSPVLSGFFLSSPALLSMPFFMAGGMKIIYDLLLFYNFRTMKPPEEKKL